MTLIEPGRAAPSFTLKNQHGQTTRLSDFKGSPLVVYFYPKDDTPGCTREACGFQELLEQFESIDVKVVGISPDDVQKHAKFAAKYDLTFPLLADPPGRDGVPAACNRWGTWQEKTNYGRTYMGIVRTTYLLDARLRVHARFDRVKVDGHVDKVLKAAGELS